MTDKELTKLYLSAVRSRKKSGARWQKTDEITIKPLGEEGSPYRRHVGDAKEPDLAVGLEVPRNFSMTTQIRNNEIEQEVKGRVRKLLDIAKQILTEQQYAVFMFMAIKDPALSVRETANVLSISSSRAGQLWKTAREKLSKAYDQRTA